MASTSRRVIGFLFAVLAAVCPVASIATEKLTACASQTPPFVLTTQGMGTGGFSVELFQQVARSLGRDAEVRDLPWARCLNEVKFGRVDVAIDAYDDEERRKKYRYSNAYYELTPQIFYLRRATAGANTGATRPMSLGELKARHGCGVFEYSYEHYDLDATTLDLGAANDKQLFKKLAAGRCDYAIEELEFIIGGRDHEPDWPDESGIASFRPAWARGPKLHFLVGASRSDSEALQAAINSAIEVSVKNGLHARLAAKYFGAARKAARH